MTSSTQQWVSNGPTYTRGINEPKILPPAAERENLLSSALLSSPVLPQQYAGFLFWFSTASP